MGPPELEEKETPCFIPSDGPFYFRIDKESMKKKGTPIFPHLNVPHTWIGTHVENVFQENRG